MSDDEIVKTIVESESGADGVVSLFESLTAKHAAFVGWVVVAGCYGFAASQWGSSSVDMASAQPYPEYGWFFLVFGMSIGVAMSASIVATIGGGEE
jgi:hypothetical protein